MNSRAKEIKKHGQALRAGEKYNHVIGGKRKL